jgi:hypothetical protein
MAWKLTTETKYDEMLEILPPALWTGLGFLVGEPLDHDADGRPRFEAFIKVGGRFYVGTAPMTVKAFRSLKAEDLPG